MRRITWTAIALSLTVFTGPVGAATSDSSKTTFWMQKGRVDGLRCTVTINGFPVWESDDVQGGSIGGQLNGYLRAGKNTVTISLRAVRRSKQRPKFVFTISEATRSTPPDQFKTVFKIELGGTRKLSLPFSVTRKLNLPKGPTVLLWEKAEKLTLNRKLRRKIGVFVRKFRQAVLKKDAKQLLQLSAFKVEEIARAEKRPSARVRKVILEGYEMMLDQKGKIRLNKINLKRLKLSLLADGRVVRVMDSKGKHTVRVERKSVTFAIPLLLAKVDGKWQLAR